MLLHLSAVWFDIAMRDSPPLTRHIVDFVLQPFTAGNQAVILFFILSGFVLSLPAINLRAQSYPVFVTRRIFRIYFPYLAALLLAVLGNMYFVGDPTPCNCYRGVWSSHVDWHLVLQHVIFIGNYRTDELNPPIWSLVLEMRISLFFPFLCAIVLRLKAIQALVLAACTSAIAIILINRPMPEPWLETVIYTMHYATLFVVGIVLARERGRISSEFRRLSKRSRIQIAIFSALLYFYGAYELLIRLPRFTHDDLDWCGDWITAIGAAGIIVLSLNSRAFSRILLWPPIHLLGRMSYSVYLLHYIVMMLFLQSLYGKLPSWLILAGAFVAIFPISWLFYRWIEIPCIDLGRKVSEYL